MRCYFLRRGHITAVEILDGITDDLEAIKRAKALFATRLSEDRNTLDGFELWQEKRFIYRYPEEPKS